MGMINIDGFHINGDVLVEYKGPAESVEVPSCVRVISKYAFYENLKLTDVSLKSPITSIGECAFYGCENLRKIDLPNTLTNIKSEAFLRCRSLKNILLPSSVTKMGKDVFFGCEDIEIAVDGGNKRYHSEGNCLIETASKTAVAVRKNSIIPLDGSVTRIGEGAFGACDNITEVVIPSVITSIGNLAFGYCFSLSSVTIPASVTMIGESAFEDCFGLRSIIYGGTSEQWQAIEKGEDWRYHTRNLTVHCIDNDITY